MMIDYSDNFKTEEDDQEETVEEVSEEIEDETVDDMKMGVVYNTPKVYLREGPGKNFDYITVLSKGDDLFVSGTKNDEDGNEWVEVTTAMGHEGFVMAEYVKIEE